MEYASVTVRFTIKDVVASSRFIAKGSSWRNRVLLPGAAIGLCAVFFLLSGAAPPNASSLDSRVFLVVLTTFVLWLIMRFFAGWRLRSERYWKERSPGMFLPNTYRVVEEGFSVENVGGQLLTHRLKHSLRGWHIAERYIWHRLRCLRPVIRRRRERK
jgi:hypothetical protein